MIRARSHISPIFCCGESKEEREQGDAYKVITQQLNLLLSNLDAEQIQQTIIAYEPVWAIGTGLTPTIEEIDETHRYIREHNDKLNKYKILYGGSVKASNAKEITGLPNVDGALIGGASLKSEEFSKILED